MGQPKTNSSIYSLGKDAGPAYWFFNSLLIVKASASQTGNAFALIDNQAAVGMESPYHVHHAEDEAFQVTEGELEFHSEGKRFVRGAGAFVFLPRDIPHGFRVVGTKTARFLILLTPGGFDGFVREAGEPAPSLTLPTPSAPDMDKLMPLVAKYRLELFGPLPK